jgi:hypothetical protein
MMDVVSLVALIVLFAIVIFLILMEIARKQ